MKRFERFWKVSKRDAELFTNACSCYDSKVMVVKAKTFLPSFCSSPYGLGSHAQRLKENKHTNKQSKTKEPRLVLNRSCAQSRVSKSRLLCPVRFWVFGRTQTLQPLWQPVWSPSWCTVKTNINNESKTKQKQPRTTQNTFLYSNHNSCISTCAHCLLPSVGPGSLFFPIGY